jgi:hypothetical protein
LGASQQQAAAVVVPVALGEVAAAAEVLLGA